MKHQQPSSTVRPGEGRVSDLGTGGDGLVHAGRTTISLARTAMGDLVRYQSQGTGRFLHGDLLEVIKAGPGRCTPGCPDFDRGCGGCQWLHMDYGTQLDWKTKLLARLIDQGLGPEIAARVEACVPMEEPRGFRNKLSLRNEGGRFHFMQEFRGRTMAPAACMVATPALEAAWQVLKDLAVPAEVLQIHLRSNHRGQVGCALFAQGTGGSVRGFARKLVHVLPSLAGAGCQTRKGWTPLEGQDWLEQEARGATWRIPHHGFWQTNQSMTARMLDMVMTAAGTLREARVLDLYCGAGLFSIPMAMAGARVHGMELNEDSIRQAAENAALNKVSASCSFQAGDAAALIAGARQGQWDTVVLDPPRAGAGPLVMEALTRISPERMVYVSCEPRGLIRDLKVLAGRDWEIRRIQPLDMFPHTHHVETVVSLSRTA